MWPFRSANSAASEGQCKAALMELETCEDRKIPRVYEAMTLEVKMNDEVIKKAMEKCYEDSIPKLFAALPDEVKMQEEVAKMAMENCYKEYIPKLFSAMPDEVKTKEEVIKKAMEIAALPDEVKMQEDIAKKAMEKCDANFIPQLFSAMPVEVKMKEEVLNMALAKCSYESIPKLFQAMPDEVKMQALLKRCYGSKIPRIFKVMPFDVHAKGDDVKEALEGCEHGRGCIPALFEVMPTPWKMNEEVLNMAFAKCSDGSIPELFQVMPDEVKMQEEAAKKAMEKCYPPRIPELFRAMPDEVKMKDDVVKKAMKKWDDGKIHELFAAMPAEVQKQADSFKALVKKVVTDVDSIDALNNKAWQDYEARLPAYLQDDEEVKSAFKRKRVSQLPFFEKYQKLLRAALEVSVTYLLLLGPIEGALWFQRSAGGKIANLSNQHWKNKTDFAQVHFEIFDGCVLSAAPQPFDMTLPLTSLKLVLITAAFGFIKRDLMTVQHDREARWKVWICVVVMVYSVIMIPITFISLVVHYIQEVSPHIPGGFKKYECLYAIVNLAPFQTNYLMYFVQFLAGEAVSGDAGVDIDGALKPFQWLVMCNLPSFAKEAKETLVQPLLSDDTSIGKLQEFKIGGKFMLFLFTLAPYLCVEIPFIITHKIPAAGCFFPFVLLILLVTGCIFAIVNRDMRNLTFVEWLKTVEEAGYMPIVPALWGLLVINEFLTLAPIYWYGGAGWFDSGLMVLVERSLWIYVMVFWTKIMTKFWSAASFINEIS